MMASAYDHLTSGAQVIDERADVCGLQAFMPRIIDHHDWSAVARTEAFDLQQAECAAGVRFSDIDSERR